MQIILYIISSLKRKRKRHDNITFPFCKFVCVSPDKVFGSLTILAWCFNTLQRICSNWWGFVKNFVKLLILFIWIFYSTTTLKQQSFVGLITVYGFCLIQLGDEQSNWYDDDQNFIFHFWILLEICMCSICVCNCSPARYVFLQMESQSSSDQTGKRGIFVWREKHEMFLLREVIIHEPYKFKVGSTERGATWTVIASELEGGLDMKVNQRSVREKFNRMIEGFKKKEAVEQRASGVDVEYNEKDQALLDILKRMAEFECVEMNEQER